MSKPALVVFDLDGTLIDADCAQEWLTFLTLRGFPKAAEAEQRCADIMLDYDSGSMDMPQYMAHWVAPICGYPVAEIDHLAEQFASEIIEPRIFPAGLRQVNAHQQRKDIVLLISASPTLVIKPIARYLGIQHVIGIDVQIMENRYSANIRPPFSFGVGKVQRMQQWLSAHHLSGTPLTVMYSDSANDLPLLLSANQAVAVNADARVVEAAREHQWPVYQWTLSD